MARQLPSLNALKTFEAAARHEGFTAAAGELCVTHTAVSKQIRDLEAWMGTALFVRTGRGVILTGAGRRLGAALSAPLDRIAEAVFDCSACGDHRHLKVSADAPMASRWLVRRLDRFRAAHPGIDLDIKPGGEFANPRGEADLAVRYGPGDWDDVEITPLSDSWDFPVCAPSLIAGRVLQEIEDIGDYLLLHEHCKEWWVDWLAEAGVKGAEQWRGAVMQHLAYEAAEAGQGFALVDYILATDALLEGRLVQPFDIELKAKESYFIVRAKGARESGPARAFREWIAAEMSETLKIFTAFKTANKAAA
jgi:LysR family glycine cleavage system transcriptional activator